MKELKEKRKRHLLMPHKQSISLKQRNAQMLSERHNLECRMRVRDLEITRRDNGLARDRSFTQHTA
jgi:hypothetical protein